MGKTSPLVAVLDRSCGDCHSNNTVWPWYTEIAVVMADGEWCGGRAATGLSAQDIETICSAARQADANAADRR